MATWHTRLTRARRAKGFDQATLARAVGASEPTISDWESGGIKMLNAERLLRVCEVLDISPYWLVRGDAHQDLGVRDVPGTWDAVSPNREQSRSERELLTGFRGLTNAQQQRFLADLQRVVEENRTIVAELTARLRG